MGDAFRIGPETMEEETEDTPWLVFFSPPYAFWTEQEAKMCGLVRWVAGRAPLGSVLVTESDQHFDPERLPGEGWDVRSYGHTQLAFFEPQPLCGMDPTSLPD
jgi:16S rRNA (guanine966-N2)-methyltransferase